jgi:hypothetical protein
MATALLVVVLVAGIASVCGVTIRGKYVSVEIGSAEFNVMDYGAKVSCISAPFGFPPQRTVCLIPTFRVMVRHSILLPSKKHLPQRSLPMVVSYGRRFDHRIQDFEA